MYFACNFKEDNFSDPAEKLAYSTNGNSIHNTLRKYIVENETVDGKMLMGDCFPEIDDVNVFISHSHADRNVAMGVANMIYRELGAKSFIDSMVWKHADDLLQELDDTYCRTNDGYYSYYLRNRTTTYVHMLLAVSLTQMMDKCDCVIFVNTPNSLCKNVIEESTTFSPWLFHELSVLRTLRVQPPPFRVEAGMEKFSCYTRNESIDFKMRLPVDIEPLYELSSRDIMSIGKLCRESDAGSNLKRLYNKLNIKKNRDCIIYG